jgi:zinc/manganese transport system ATP-binding protein
MVNSVDSVITAHSLTIGYAKQIIVKELNLAIDKGEFIAILGANGSGKSSFFKVLLGLLQPLHGTIQVQNKTPYRGHPDIGYMPQIRRQLNHTHLSGRAMLKAAYHGTCYGFSHGSRQDAQEIEELLTLVQVNQIADKPFMHLSGGEKQRLYLALALINRPSILLLDEPLTHLDPSKQNLFIELLQAIRRKTQVTILFTAHDPNPLIKVLDRVLYFAQGLSAIGTIDEIINNRMLSKLYGTPIEVVKINEQLFVLNDCQYQNQHWHTSSFPSGIQDD